MRAAQFDIHYRNLKPMGPVNRVLVGLPIQYPEPHRISVQIEKQSSATDP